MPKLKTNSSVKKRFRATATGKVKAQAGNRNHFKSKRSSRALVACRHGKIMGDAHKKQIKKLSPYGLK
ncbi:MAG: 50S ribosomal protein L35 [Rickettsiales bacterium]|jgi:large subunit ribosomal protein L35|nr:50S ribosomal protein L35 [Rickettsiales bacterium]